MCFTWAFFRLPEPSGRTFLELDALFISKTPARKFKSANPQLGLGQQLVETPQKVSEIEHREA